MWNLWGLSRTYKTLPSVLLDVENSWDAWCLNNAVAYFGTHVEEKIDEESSKAKTDQEKSRKRDAVLRRYIPELAKARKFADPGKR